MGLKILVLGGGAREHALVWKCEQSPLVERVIAAPGNGASQEVGHHATIVPTDIADVLALVHEQDIDLIVIGPDDVVAAGIADHLAQAGRAVFGPSAAAGRVESSKAYAKELMRAAAIPTADFEVFDDVKAARDYARSFGHGLVVKADGLALGKGVTVCPSVGETLEAIERAMVSKDFGDAGGRILLEEPLSGPELSLMCFCDGETAVPMAPARDYKRAGDGDAGANTGGMGAYSPPSDANHEVVDLILRLCAQPLVAELAARGTPYRGCLYTQVMMTTTGPMVIEYNARLGDPEAQVVLPRLESDLVEVMLACAGGSLAGADLAWSPRPTVGVVLASGGYPGAHETGKVIHGLDELDQEVLAFHAGTQHTSTDFITSGGRVLTVVASGDTVKDARERVYANVARVSFDGAFYRRDIAAEDPALTA